MNPVGNFVKGFMTVITVTAAPQLYRYPYRTSAEALRGDFMRVGGDMENALNLLPQKQDSHGQ